MKAKATSYKGEVFRSRLESYMYEYLILMYEPETIEYEPKHYTTRDYSPDFIVSTSDEHFAVEVKPFTENANWPKYLQWRENFSAINYILLLTPNGYQKVDSYGNKWEGLLNKLQYFQAINNVKHELNTRTDGSW